MEHPYQFDDYQPGVMVRHPVFGKGIILASRKGEKDEIGLEDDRVHVQFEKSKSKWLVLKRAQLILLGADEVAVAHEKDSAPWWSKTFMFEEEGAPHYCGSHWEPFVEDNLEIFRNLPERMSQAILQQTYSDKDTQVRELPADWPNGFHMCDRLSHFGLGVTVCIDNELKQNRIVSLYPFWHNGAQVRLTIKKVDVWHGGCEAQIIASWGDAEVRFFDTQFMANRLFYEAGQNYQFNLMAIAYSAAPAQSITTTIKYSPETLAKINALLTRDGGEAIEAEQEIGFDGAAIFLPVNGWDIDDYSFRATIKETREFYDFLGQKGWRVKATVMRGIGLRTDDANLIIAITQRSWRGDLPPQVGQDIEGRLWLQGYLEWF